MSNYIKLSNLQVQHLKNMEDCTHDFDYRLVYTFLIFSWSTATKQWRHVFAKGELLSNIISMPTWYINIIYNSKEAESSHDQW